MTSRDSASTKKNEQKKEKNLKDPGKNVDQKRTNRKKWT